MRQTDTTGVVYLFSDQNGNQQFNGYIDELRISNTARWTANFTPPTIPYGQQYVTGPYYVATTDATQIDVSTYASIHSATLSTVEPVTTTVKWAVSFDHRATWKYWTGTAWASIGGLTAANLESYGNTTAAMAAALAGVDVTGVNTINLAYSLKTTNQSYTPSVDNALLAMDEYQQIAPVTGYSSKRRKPGRTQPHTITNLGATAYLVVDHAT